PAAAQAGATGTDAATPPTPVPATGEPARARGKSGLHAGRIQRPPLQGCGMPRGMGRGGDMPDFGPVVVWRPPNQGTETLCAKVFRLERDLRDSERELRMHRIALTAYRLARGHVMEAQY